MKKKHFCSIGLLFLLTAQQVLSQTGSISGRVYNEINNEPIPYANIVLDTIAAGTSSDESGAYRLDGLKPGIGM